MKVLYEKGVANHLGPESCAVARKDGREVLTGERASWVLSREMMFVSGVQAFSSAEDDMLDGVDREPSSARRGLRPHARTEAFYAGAGRSYDRPRVRHLGPQRESLGEQSADGRS